MGKSEILMLLAGVALSVMLAMIAIPMFQSGSEMADKQQVQHDLMSIKSGVPLIISLEGSVTAANITKHMKGFEVGTIAPDVGKLINSASNKANYTIDGNSATALHIGQVSVTVSPTGTNPVDLTKLTRLNEICDGYATDDPTNKATGHTVTTNSLTCYIKK